MADEVTSGSSGSEVVVNSTTNAFEDLINISDKSQINTPDPHQPPYNLEFPSDVNSYSDPQVEGERPHIDFIIEDYTGSQFPKGETGLLPELAKLASDKNTLNAVGSALSYLGLTKLKTSGSSGGSDFGPTIGGEVIQTGLGWAGDKVKGFLNEIPGFIDTVQQGAQTPNSTKTGAPGPGHITYKGNIRLYLPHSIQEQFAATWTESDVNLAGALAIRGIDAMADIQNHLGTEGKRIIGDYAGGGNVMASPELQNILMRQDGKALNNHLEAFFKGVGFRKFSYTFQLNPRSKKEAETIQQIVKAFKVAAAPALATPGEYYGRFFKYPNQFKISYWNSGKVHQLSTCILESIAVNYSAGQSNMTFRDNRPLQTDLTLNFKELEIMHKKKFLDGY
jgi:hypothetical protein